MAAKNYILWDPESGEPYEVPEEVYKRHQEMKEYFMSKIQLGIAGTNPVGKIIIISTTANAEDGDIKSLWESQKKDTI